MLRQANLKEPIIEVVALVLENNQGDILLTQRQSGKHLAGYWEFPGGKVENNETLLEALIREINEELAYTPHQAAHLTTINHRYPEKTVNIHFYHCIDNTATVNPQENQAMQWVHKSNLNAIKLPPANQPVIKLLQ